MGPEITKSGLIFYFDAGDKNSYSGTGTSITDLSGNDTNGTLINGPTFNSTNGGSIAFDGVDDYINFPSSGSLNQTFNSFSFCIWLKPSAIPTNGSAPMAVFGKDNTGCGNRGSSAYITCNGYLNFIHASTNCPGASYMTNNQSALTANVWRFISATVNSTSTVEVKWYSATTNTWTWNQSSSYPVTLNNTANFRIGDNGTNSLYQGVFCGDTNVSSAKFNGNIAWLSMYNTVLTQSDIAKNYNATKSRFGL